MTEKHYTNDEIAVIWKPDLCVHSGVCVKNQPEVFKPEERPCVKIDAATSNEIMRTVKKFGHKIQRLKNDYRNCRNQ